LGKASTSLLLEEGLVYSLDDGWVMKWLLQINALHQSN
jgi:hypothetical protein